MANSISGSAFRGAAAARSAPAMRRASVLVFLCGVILGVDVGQEGHAALANARHVPPVVWAHIVIEVLATCGLGWAYVLIRQELRRAQAAERSAQARVAVLRGAFDTLMRARFAQWGLSEAETDIALLTVRGLRIAEIAQARGVRDGTVKAQLSSIFRKAGVSTRTELLARFMDEFLDHGAETGP